MMSTLFFKKMHFFQCRQPNILVTPLADETKQWLAQYVIAVYDLSYLDSVKTTTAPHILEFTCQADPQRLPITGHILYQT